MINYKEISVKYTGEGMEAEIIYNTEVMDIYDSMDLVRPGNGGQVLVDRDKDANVLQIWVDNFHIPRFREAAEQFAANEGLIFPDLKSFIIELPK